MRPFLLWVVGLSPLLHIHMCFFLNGNIRMVSTRPPLPWEAAFPLSLLTGGVIPVSFYANYLFVIQEETELQASGPRLWVVVFSRPSPNSLFWVVVFSGRIMNKPFLFVLTTKPS